MSDGKLLHAPLTRAAWKGRSVLILGLGQFPQGSGVTAALTFAKLGARVTVTDLKTKDALGSNVATLKRYKNVRFVLGRHDASDVKTAELIVANPRVRPSSKEMTLARRLKIPVTSDIALFLDRCPATVIAVTGTRGKSTTSSLIASMINASGKKVWLGGNILVSPLTFLSKVKPRDIVVLELSSWQCESLGSSKPPHISVVTNMMRDHLNTYDGMDDYAEAKAQVFRHQKKDDVVILNADDAYGKVWINEAPGRVKTFSTKRGSDAVVTGDVLHVLSCDYPMRSTKLLGAHNAMNAAAAILAARSVGVSRSATRKGLNTFKPLADRLETIRVLRGVTYINDTCATTPDGTIAAIETLSKGHRHLWLIAGGADKELVYDELAKTVKKHRPHIHILLLPGDASDKIRRALSKVRAHIHPVNDVAGAVTEAAKRAVKGDAVVLSPGATSFSQFANEFERGKAFVQAVRKLRG